MVSKYSTNRKHENISIIKVKKWLNEIYIEDIESICNPITNRYKIWRWPI
jgi:hypothetical protein